ncbi:hypothetical protein NP233_g5515 [Leucocoprinus birnbaumii]|uniref:Transcription factor CBF/NF-Y/archaeal histone domain-containing protein n=1 Tax=Leucocoprinus birnbaumii TaxID=56174 RepID=A0AAD5VTY7_9AGAR|nr:hypothetical protein NP233_g5515 [Leucocoprinus birnbaumii]
MPRPDPLASALHEQNDNDDSSLDNFTTDVVVSNDIDDAITESEPDAEEEIDQLDSDSDVPPQPPAEVPAPNPKKPSQSRSGERRKGQSLFPANRVENILQSEGLMGSNMNVSKEGVFLLSVATEEFVRKFSTLAHGRAQYYNRNMIRYDDMAAVVKNRTDFGRFLRDYIPTPRPLHSAFAARQKRERDMLRDDPAMQPPERHFPFSDWPESDDEYRSSSPGVPVLGPLDRRFTKALGTLFRPQSEIQSERRQAPKAPTITKIPNPLNVSFENLSVAQPTETWEEYKERSRRMFAPGDASRPKSSKSSSNLTNGGYPSYPVPFPINFIPQSHSDYPGNSPETGSRSDAKRRSSPRPTVHQYKVPLTGPGSAFLQGPGVPFPPPSSSSTSSNRHPTTVGSSSSSTAPPPGRTIYSTDVNKSESAD